VKPLEYYKGREQTYLKHFFLERYLERVAYHIGFSQNEFVYVDCFSGPWKTGDETLADTSFMIALKKLESVREGLGRVGRYPRMRCLFIEKDENAYKALDKAIQPRTNVKALRGEFIEVIPHILEHLGGSFSIAFVDPTGWTGFGLEQITPLLKHAPGEVIINFMFDHINRFLTHPDDKVGATFNQLFGGTGWDGAVTAGPGRERAIINLYVDRLRSAGAFRYATYTRILKPTEERSYYYLVYATRHPKGIIKFREVERQFVHEQERVRLVAKQEKRVKRTGQGELFAATLGTPAEASFQQEREAQLDASELGLHDRLKKERRIEYEDLVGKVLEKPLVWESDVKEMLKRGLRKGTITIEGLAPRERVPKAGHIIIATV